MPAVVTTVLGSCVAICLWDRERRIGGINHFLLPRCGNSAPTARYGDVAFSRLLDAMQQRGCRPDRLTAKLFGGATVLPVGKPSTTVGLQNIELALEVLSAHGIPILARHTGGQHGMYLRYYTALNRVMVRELKDPREDPAQQLFEDLDTPELEQYVAQVLGAVIM